MQERKFLDLDHICDDISDENDRKMFREAIRCYQIDSYRAAVILAWSVTADRLSRRIDELAAENDGLAQQARTCLHNSENTARYEEVLITQARKCELIDDYDEKCLRFARDTRSKCAHPTGVIPAAEAVRHILYICSQIVLCRNGYRGISFIKDFVAIKLKDRHLFSNNQRIETDCKYFLDKVPERAKLQFGTEITKNFDSSDYIWLENTLIFLDQFFLFSDTNSSIEMARKLQGIEKKDRKVFSLIVGLSQKAGVWDSQEINQSKSHLREILSSGKVDARQFKSYGNLCALNSIEENDSDLLKSRFSLFIEHISKHEFLQEKCGNQILSFVIEAFDDEGISREQVMKGLADFSCLDLTFTDQSAEKNEKFIENLIQENWREENMVNTWEQVSSWSPFLLSALTNKTIGYLSECSEDFPDDILVLFDGVSNLVQKSPGLIDGSFEQAIIDIFENKVRLTWYIEKGETYQNFIGQISLLKERYAIHFPRIASCDLPPDTEVSDEAVDEY